MDLGGKVIKSVFTGTSEVYMHISESFTGIYFSKIYNKAGQVLMNKIIK